MGIIKIMDKTLANQIAAGEVVERPASVIKELTENAIDAGATNITVEIKQGGTSFMRVTDNGKGIAPEDVEKAFFSHATSKLYLYEDLLSLHTLGFRGEALSSIAAVARVEMLTKPTGAVEGTHFVIEGAEPIVHEPAGCPEGTTVIVRDLFYNTPARLKFLKKDAAEAAQISDILEKEALAYPNISFHFINNGKEQFFTAGDNNLISAVHALFGKEYAKEMLAVSHEANGVKVCGLIGSSILTRPNRNRQLSFVNDRCVVNRTLITAIAEAYKNQITIGRFPVCVLKVYLPTADVDVNVHPSKTEIKFLNDRAVYDAVYWGIKNTLYEIPHIPSVQTQTPSEEAEKAPTVPPVSELTDRSPQEAFSPAAILEDMAKQGAHTLAPPYFGTSFASAHREPIQKHAGATLASPDFLPQVLQEKPAFTETEPEPFMPKEPQQTSFCTPQEDEPSPIVIGQAFSTYIFAVQGEELLIYDQHAAHERLCYEALLKERAEGSIPSQMLLMPVSVSVTAPEMAVFLENETQIASMGFDAEALGTQTILLRELPADIGADDAPQLFGEILTLLADKKIGTTSERIDKALYTIACKAAIRAGHELTRPEMERLIHDCEGLGAINTCPHGRPFRIKMSKKQLEKEFLRT